MSTNPHAGAVKKYFVKKKIKKLDKSQTWKGDLGKNKRLDGLKTRKGGPSKIRDMNKNNYPNRLKNPQGRSMQKLRIMTK